ncbi:MAG: hypothetical protein HQM16_01895 [Deltaproteobacteria bacterium]|nr:hypothetical protein [Deltaproteobacteria bacterium]
MKLVIELSRQEELVLMRYVTKTVAGVTENAIKKYFRYIKNDDFIRLLRRALKLSSDSYLQQFMQYYVDQRAPHIFKKLHKDILKQTGKRPTKL